MDIQSIIREAGPIANAFNVFVIALGYYFLVRLSRESLHERQRQRTAGGRPQVVVALDHGRLPEISLVVRNFTDAPAKDITFDFSAPVESPDGTVISDLPFFRKGLPFLEPEGRIDCHWGDLPSLAPLLREKGLEDGIGVTTRYKDLAEESYKTEFKVNPLLFEGPRIEDQKDMSDLVNAVESISGVTGARHRKVSSGRGD